ncbi:hypothetical protein DB313_06200 (plasmid) [Borrelia turcica IST7]|uniref:DUF276 domain-containing protein n=1 Tax=Borrelia turcica IST7 TaxID=1104446 RepID=A0A386PNP5_9SPIR|nr:DUF276 domain-containing protein [Borrelia turcica]AYE37091.1 hypothetical protein DB313_06200 [Borrelia turcica IST7]
MSRIFDKDFGILPKSISDIVADKRAYLKDMYGIDIKDDHSSIYNIIANSLAITESQIIDELLAFFNKMKPDGLYWTAIQAHISAKSTTYEAIKTALLATKHVKYANILSKAGKATIYLILDDDIDLNKSPNSTETSLFKASLWEVIYHTLPSGTLLEGDIDIDGYNSQGQLKSYKVSLGKLKYCYLKATYKLDLKNYIYLEIDKQIRDIYTRIVESNYRDMGISFEYQDFIAPVNEVLGIASLCVSACVKDTETTPIASLSSSDFKENEDIKIKDDEILLFDMHTRLLVDIKSS